MTSQSIRAPASGRRDSLTLATRICAHCPVPAEHLTYTLSGVGTRGSATSRERAQLRRQHRTVAA